MSWIVTSPAGKVVELYERPNVEKARAAGWKIEEAGAYLKRMNAEIKHQDSVRPFECEECMDTGWHERSIDDAPVACVNCG
jgi:hypothetical protein